MVAVAHTLLGDSLAAREAAQKVAAMTKANVKRLVAISGLGAGITLKNRGLMFDQVLARTTLKGLLDDQNGMEAEIRKSRVDWVVVRPGTVLMDEPAKKKFVLSLDGAVLVPKISRQDLALFMLDQLESTDALAATSAFGDVDDTHGCIDPAAV